MRTTELSELGRRRFPRLFEPWRLGPVEVPNRIVMAPSHSSWTRDPFSGVFGDRALPYYTERARGGVGLIMIGATMVHPSSRAGSAPFPQLYDDRNVEPLAEICQSVHDLGGAIGVQLFHGGVRNAPILQQLPGADPDDPWHSLAPSEIPLGELPGSGSAKEMTEAEIAEVIDAFGAAAGRAIEAGADGVEFHLAHGYLPWQFLSPMYNRRTDRWGGSLQDRLRFSVEALRGIRAAVGDAGFVGYRISAEAFWPGDLTLDDVTEAVAALDGLVEVDYVSVTVGVDHAWIHSPMWFEEGWEAPYARAVKAVTTRPTMMVGRVTTPQAAEQLLTEGSADAVALGRQMFADPEWARKAAMGETSSIRQCVGANRCWRTAGRSLQCVHNPVLGREARWGHGTLVMTQAARRVLVIGGGPAGLEYARVAAERGHDVVVVEREAEFGGHVLLEARLPTRDRYGEMTRWLAHEARRHGARLVPDTAATPDNLEEVLARFDASHVVLATGSSWRRDGFQGWTGRPLPGWEHARCVPWTEVMTGRAEPTGEVVIVDDAGGVQAPLTALHLARLAQVRIITRWPMIGMDTVPDMYFPWVRSLLYEAEVEVICDHVVTSITESQVHTDNVHARGRPRAIAADWIVMVTARTSQRQLEPALTTTEITWEAIGDAVAPRTAYEAIYEAHRQARKL